MAALFDVTSYPDVKNNDIHNADWSAAFVHLLFIFVFLFVYVLIVPTTIRRYTVDYDEYLLRFIFGVQTNKLKQ